VTRYWSQAPGGEAIGVLALDAQPPAEALAARPLFQGQQADFQPAPVGVEDSAADGSSRSILYADDKTRGLGHAHRGIRDLVVLVQDALQVALECVAALLNHNALEASRRVDGHVWSPLATAYQAFSPEI